MKKELFIIGLTFVLIAVGLSGCTTDNEENGEAKTLTMNAEQLSNDFDLNTDLDTFMTMGFKSLDEGDTLVLQDIISEIIYDSIIDATKITFEVDSESESLTGFSAEFWFKGDITTTYHSNDEIKITMTIKHVSFEKDGASIDWEIFTEMWEDEEYYTSHISTATKGMKPMLQNIISLVKAAEITEGKTLYVDDDGGKDYSSIQEAIDAAAIGDIVYVYNGLYTENVEINKKITLTGENKNATIIDGVKSGNVVNVTANYVELSGFRIQNSGDSFFDAGIYIESNSITISDNHIINNEYGISMHGCSYCTVDGNIVENNSWDGIDITSWSEYNEILNNIVQDNGFDGISLSGFSDYNIIHSNEVKNNMYVGIDLTSSYANNIYHNNIMGNQENANESSYGSSGDEDNIWDNGLDQGNYWGDYSGLDSDEDDIGDTAYEISGGINQDRFPLMSQYQQ